MGIFLIQSLYDLDFFLYLLWVIEQKTKCVCIAIFYQTTPKPAYLIYQMLIYQRLGYPSFQR